VLFVVGCDNEFNGSEGTLTGKGDELQIKGDRWFIRRMSGS
jgi:hypothetical protein